MQSTPDLMNFVGGFWLLMVFCIVVAILASLFWIWMLVNALVTEPTPMDKLLWFFVIFFLHVIGALIYFFVRYGQRRQSVF